jgi:hypothetical protein
VKVMSELVRLGRGASRLLLAVPMALAIIAGLLSMHVLTAPHEPAHGAAIAAMTTEGLEGASPSVVVTVASTGSADAGVAPHCPGECDDPGGLPDHSALMMTCVLALLTAALVLFASIRRVSGTRFLGMRRSHLRVPLAGLWWPRPPSLLVLCISRT